MKPIICYAYMRARRTLVTGAVVFGALVAALMVWSAATAAIVEALPARLWLDVRSVRVDDAPHGTPPTIHVDLTIRRAFSGRWYATIWSMTGAAPWAVCVASAPAEIRYKPGTPNPIGRDLDWWLAPTECQLAPGAYQMTTVWEIRVFSGFTTHASAESNVFQIRDPHRPGPDQ